MPSSFNKWLKPTFYLPPFFTDICVIEWIPKERTDPENQSAQSSVLGCRRKLIRLMDSLLFPVPEDSSLLIGEPVLRLPCDAHHPRQLRVPRHDRAHQRGRVSSYHTISADDNLESWLNILQMMFGCFKLIASGWPQPKLQINCTVNVKLRATNEIKLWSTETKVRVLNFGFFTFAQILSQLLSCFLQSLL